MVKANGMRVTAAILLLIAALLPCTAFAAEVLVDDFSDAMPPPGTLLGDPPSNVLVDAANTTETGTDTGVNGVIGGVRVLSVSVASCTFCPFDNTIVGVLPPSLLVDYSSSSGADGSFQLFYDAGGSGLNAMLSFAQGIRVPLSNIDASAYPLFIQMTLTSGANVATRSFTFPAPGLLSMDVDFLFSAFTGIAGINLDDISSIRIEVDPNGGSAAGDLQMLPIFTFGTPPNETTETCLNGLDDDNDGAVDCNDPDCVLVEPACAAPAPALSPDVMVLLVLVLTGAGALGIGRLRSRLD